MAESINSTHTRETGTVLVSGGFGLLGSCVSKLFLRSGWKVISLSHADLDITDDRRVRLALEKFVPEIIINCAATADVDRCEREPDWAAAVNEHGPRILAWTAREIGAAIVHVSTDYVFDGSKTGFYTQEDQALPLSVYGKSKLAGELAVQEETPRHYVVRTSWLFGVGGKNFGSRAIELARKGKHLKAVTDQISIPTYAPDVAKRIQEIIRAGEHGLYQVTSSGPASWFEFARAALDLSGLKHFEVEPIHRADLNQPAPRPANSAMRCLLSERLGLLPLRHWREALVDFVQEQS
jgi:dTDP-4-dehydrorhamnose reductase